MRALFVSVVLVSFACGPAPSGPDGGPGAGGGSGGGSAGTATLTVSAAPRRGPIAIGVVASREPWTLTVRVDGGSKPATLLRGSARDGGVGELTWQSFDDVDSDGPVELEVESGGTVLGRATVNVRNDATTARLVTVGHPLVGLDGGGVTARHTEVSLGRWNGATLSDVRRLPAGLGPRLHRAAPHGRATVVVGDTGGDLTLIETPLDANPAAARVLHAAVRLPRGSVIDARFSHDGRHLYVVGSAPQGSSDYTLWRFTPSEDLVTLGAAVEVAEVPGPALRFDVDRETGRVVLPVGPGLQGRPTRVMVVDPWDAAGNHVTPLVTGTPAGFGVSPKGGLLLVADETNLPGLALVALGTSSSTLVTRDTVIAEPADVVFHPASDGARSVALVSQPFRNRATPVVVTPNGLTLGTAVTGLPLGSTSDVVERGPGTGTVFITGVTELFRVQLNAATGAATNQGAVFDFGSEPTDQAEGVAVQR